MVIDQENLKPYDYLSIHNLIKQKQYLSLKKTN